MWTFPLFLLASGPTNYLAEQHLKDHGYSYCYWYTGKTMSTPDIWVREPEYCQNSKKSVISDMFVWLDKRIAEGDEPTPMDVHVFMTEKRKEYDKKYSVVW